MSETTHVYLRQRAASLVDGLTHAFVVRNTGGSMSASAYETAWVARIPHPQNPDALAFPEALDWLLRRQHKDGSWGPTYPHSVLATLAALTALRSAPLTNNWIRHSIVQADTYLHQTLPLWDPEAVDTPFIEFLAPALLDDLARLGMHYRVNLDHAMTRRMHEKLRHFPLSSLYTGTSPLVHALEALRQHVDYQRLRTQQPDFGGYGYSPSATAASLMYGEWDERAAGWLRQLSDQRLDGVAGGMPSSHPSDIFEAAWVLHYLQRAGLVTVPQICPLLEWLRASMTTGGFSFGHVAAMPTDVDDTAMSLIVLAQGGLPIDVTPIWQFALDDHFVSYAHERTTSTSANAHALEALAHAPTGDGTIEMWRKHVLAYLFAQQREGWWRDKWHISRYYATDCCAQAVMSSGAQADMIRLGATRDWLLRTQHRDGGWGEMDSTIEETAYALLTLHAIGTRNQATQRGAAYLWRHRHFWRFDSVTLPHFWVDKSLYAPPRVIEAAALAALSVTLVENTP